MKIWDPLWSPLPEARRRFFPFLGIAIVESPTSAIGSGMEAADGVSIATFPTNMEVSWALDAIHSPQEAADVSKD